MIRPWSSYWDGRSRGALRIGIATIAAVEFVGQAAQVSRMAADPAHYERLGWMARALDGHSWAAWVFCAMVLAGLAALATDRRPIAGGLWALAWMALLVTWQMQLFGSPSRNAFFPGAALLGWVLGLAWARLAAGPQAASRQGRPYRERLGEAGALACVAAGYVGSAASKLLAAGTGWADATTVRALLLWQRPVARWDWLLAYRDALIESPGLSQAAAVLTLVVEGGAVMLLFGARLRLVWAALILGMHVNIILLCTMPYLEPMALLLLLAIPWPRLLGRPPVDDPLSARQPELEAPRVPKAVLGLLAATVALAWLLAPLGWQAGG